MRIPFGAPNRRTRAAALAAVFFLVTGLVSSRSSVNPTCPCYMEVTKDIWGTVHNRCVFNWPLVCPNNQDCILQTWADGVGGLYEMCNCESTSPADCTCVAVSHLPLFGNRTVTCSGSCGDPTVACDESQIPQGAWVSACTCL
jgi:hypothetical protein